MDQEGLKVPYHVDRTAWTVAIGSLLVIAAIISAVGYYSFEIYRNLYLSKIQSTVANRQYQEADRYLNALFRGPPILNLFSRSNSATSQSGKEAGSTLIKIMGELTPQSLPTAHRQVEGLRKKLSLSPDLPPEAVEILKKLEIPLGAAAAVEQQLEGIIGEKSKLASKSQDTRTQFDLLAKDTSELFSLPPDAIAAQGATPSFYSSGVLANLPSLQGLPDAIPTLDDLKVQLSKAGGGVHLQGENIQVIFSDRLQKLSTSGGSLRETLDSVEKSLSLSDRQISALSSQLERDTKVLSTQFDSALEEMLASFSAPGR